MFAKVGQAVKFKAAFTPTLQNSPMSDRNVTAKVDDAGVISPKSTLHLTVVKMSGNDAELTIFDHHADRYLASVDDAKRVAGVWTAGNKGVFDKKPAGADAQGNFNMGALRHFGATKAIPLGVCFTITKFDPDGVDRFQGQGLVDLKLNNDEELKAVPINVLKDLVTMNSNFSQRAQAYNLGDKFYVFGHPYGDLRLGDDVTVTRVSEKIVRVETADGRVGSFANPTGRLAQHIKDGHKIEDVLKPARSEAQRAAIVSKGQTIVFTSNAKVFAAWEIDGKWRVGGRIVYVRAGTTAEVLGEDNNYVYAMEDTQKYTVAIPFRELEQYTEMRSDAGRAYGSGEDYEVGDRFRAEDTIAPSAQTPVGIGDKIKVIETYTYDGNTIPKNTKGIVKDVGAGGLEIEIEGHEDWVSIDAHDIKRVVRIVRSELQRAASFWNATALRRLADRMEGYVKQIERVKGNRKYTPDQLRIIDTVLELAPNTIELAGNVVADSNDNSIAQEYKRLAANCYDEMKSPNFRIGYYGFPYLPFEMFVNWLRAEARKIGG